jgi:hypothetical protein
MKTKHINTHYIIIKKHLNDYSLLYKAITNKKKLLLTLNYFIIFVTIFLSLAFYVLETSVQPSKFPTFWSVLEWTIAKYINNIGGYGDSTPITCFGKIIATIIGILSIVIVALPAGIITSGLIEELNKKNEKKKLKRNTKSLKRAFCTERFVPVLQKEVRRGALNINSIEVKLNISKQDVIELVRCNKNLRLRAKALSGDHKVIDSTYVEYFEINTTYGSKIINPYSLLTIVSPDSHCEQSVGYFTYCLSMLLESNYITNELFGDAIYSWNETFHNDGLAIDEKYIFEF